MCKHVSLEYVGTLHALRKTSDKELITEGATPWPPSVLTAITSGLPSSLTHSHTMPSSTSVSPFWKWEEPSPTIPQPHFTYRMSYRLVSLTLTLPKTLARFVSSKDGHPLWGIESRKSWRVRFGIWRMNYSEGKMPMAEKLWLSTTSIQFEEYKYFEQRWFTKSR